MTSSERKVRIKIENILNGEYSDFLIYCGIAGKTYTDEITDVDYIAYRSRFGYGKADAQKLRAVIENTPHEDDNADTAASGEPVQVIPSSDYFADAQNRKRAYADILALNPENYKDISLKSSTASAFAEALSARVLNRLNRTDCFTLADLLQMTPEELRGVRNLGAKSVKIIEKALSRLVNFVPPLKKQINVYL